MSMKLESRSYSLLLALTLVFLIPSCVSKSKYVKMQTHLQMQNDSLQVLTDEKSEQLEMISSYIDTIAASIDSITRQEVLLLSRTNSDGVSYSKKQIRENLDMLEALINRQRSKIYELDSTLVVMSDSTNSLRSVITFLYTQLEQKDLEIQKMKAEIGQQNRKIRALTSQVTSLQTDVSELTTKSKEQTEAILAQNATIAQQDSLLYTAYYIIDSKKGLRDKGIISGSVFKSNKIDFSNIDHSLYTKVDIRETTVIVINASKAKVVSPMPASSYYIYNISPDVCNLVITDSKAFWSANKVLVIQK